MIAVTGATGLLGSFVTQRLLAEGTSVVAIKRKESTPQVQHQNLIWRIADVQDPVSLREVFAGVTRVVHAAAVVSFDPRRRTEIFETNTAGTKNVVNACMELGIEKLVHVSSVAAIGRKKGDEILDETAQWVNGPLNSDYAKSKYLAELEVYRGVEEGLNASIVNPSFILAPVSWDKSSAKIFRYVWDENKFYSSGTANFVDVNDVVDVIHLMLQKNFSGQRFIASGGSIPYKDLFGEIAARFDKQRPSISVPSSLMPALARIEEFRSWLSSKEPTISRESIKSAQAKTVYSNTKAVKELGIKFKTLSQTLDVCCYYFLRTYSTKKL